MWFLLLIFAFTSANLVDTEDNIAMESQATQYRAKYYRPDVYHRGEHHYSDEYETNEYNHKGTTNAKRPKKYHESKNEKENVYINKNNYANRAREPRDETPWRPVVHQNEEETGQNSNNYHYQESTVKPQKHYYYYSSESSKQPKKHQESHSEPPNYVHRYKPTTQETISSYHESNQAPRETYPSNPGNPSEALQTPFAYLKRYEENIHGGKMLGFSSLVEHFAEDEMNDEEIKTALKEGSLEDIKRIVPKSGAVFEIYSDDDNENTQYVPKNEAINNNVDQNDVASSATTYSYTNKNNWANYKNSNKPSASATAPTKSYTPFEKKKQVKAAKPREPNNNYPDNTRQQHSNDKDEESNVRIAFHNQKSKPTVSTFSYSQSHQHPKPSHDHPISNYPIIQETRVYPQIEAASKQNYRPIQSVLSDQNDYYRSRQNEDYRTPQKSALQSQQESISQNHANNYYSSNIKGYSNYSHNLQNHSPEKASETETNQPGNNLRTSTIYSSIPKPSESSKYYYDHYRHPNYIIQNNKPESFDHQKALQGSFSFNSGNILGNHSPIKQEPEHNEASRSPIQFSSETENGQKQTSSQPGPKHIQQYVQSIFKSVYKTQEDPKEEESKPYRYQLDIVPRPEALVSLKHPPKFDAETPMMTEEEFQSKFGHLPVVVSTPKSPYYASTLNIPAQNFFGTKFTKPQAEALTQYWAQQEKENKKLNKYPTPNDINLSKFKRPSTSQTSDGANHSPPKHSNKFNDFAEESSNTVSKYTKGQIEKPSLSGWKNGKIYLTKEFDGKFSDLYIKSSDKENIQHPGYSGQARPISLKKLEGNHKNIILSSNFAHHVQETSPMKHLKYDINLSPSFRFQKRGDPDQESKNISIVSEHSQSSLNQEKRKIKKQGIVLTGSNDKDLNHFSVSASYRIDRNDKSEEERK